MKIQTRMKDLASGKPVPDGVHRFKVTKMDEKDFETGSWGFLAPCKCIASDAPGAMGRMVFENFVLITPEGDLSPAAFKFGQAYLSINGEDVEIEAETTEDAKDQFRILAETLVNKEFSATTEIQAATEEGMRDMARIVKYL